LRFHKQNRWRVFVWGTAMNLQDLPRFPDESDKVRRERINALPSRQELLSILFEFGTGLALANSIFLGLLAPWFTISALELLIVESTMLFGYFTVIVVGNKISSVPDDMPYLSDTGQSWVCAVFFALGGVLGVGLGIGFGLIVTHVFGGLGVTLNGPLENVVASTMFGAVIGLVAAAGLAVAGGTPERITGKIFNSLGRIIPHFLRQCLFRKRRRDIKLPGKPWVEGVVWASMVGGPIVWLTW